MRLSIKFLLLGFLAFVSNACQGAEAVSPAFAPAPGTAHALVHRDSGFVFPAQIGSFQRISTRQFDSMGRDVSVGYNSGLSQVVATLYVYPTEGRTLEQEFARRQAEVAGVHPGVKPLTRGTASVTPRKVRALSAEYSLNDRFAGHVQALRSLLLVAQRGERFVEYRFTYPASARNVSAGVARQLAQDYAWPPTGPAR